MKSWSQIDCVLNWIFWAFGSSWLLSFQMDVFLKYLSILLPVSILFKQLFGGVWLFDLFFKGTPKDPVNYAYLHSVLWLSPACRCGCPLDSSCSLFFSPVPCHGYTVQAQLWPEQCHQCPCATWRTSPVQRWDGGVVGLRSQLVRRSTGEVWQRLQWHPSGLCKWKTMIFLFVNSFTFSTPLTVLLVPGPWERVLPLATPSATDSDFIRLK